MGRACPGIHFAESSMFIAFATALATCMISDAVDANGIQVPKNVDYQSGTIRCAFLMSDSHSSVIIFVFLKPSEAILLCYSASL